jgi:Fic family protein
VDITAWLVWFLSCVERSIIKAEDTLSAVLQKAEFWKRYANTSFNERQRKMLNKLLDGFEGKLKTSKWAKITHCAQFTALRDIQDLIAKGILQEEAGGGRSTSYALKPCTHEQRHSFMECGAQPARDR